MMRKKHIIILGAGISGLSAAWYLNRSDHPVDVTVIEKTNRAGGWLHTEHSQEFHFEKGPRTFKVDKMSIHHAAGQRTPGLAMKDDLDAFKAASSLLMAQWGAASFSYQSDLFLFFSSDTRLYFRLLVGMEKAL